MLLISPFPRRLLEITPLFGRMGVRLRISFFLFKMGSSGYSCVPFGWLLSVKFLSSRLWSIWFLWYENRHKNVNLSYFIKVYLYVLYLPFEIVNFWSSGILKFLGGYGVEGLSGQDRACWRKRPPWGAFTAGDFFYVCLMLYDCDADLEGVKEYY